MLSLFLISNFASCLLRPIVVPPRLLQWEPIVRKESCLQGIDPRLPLAVIDVESAGVKYAKNSRAIGLMQIKLATARLVGYTGSWRNLFNPRNNIHFGVRYLSRLSKKYKYGWDVAAAYNCGKPHWRRGRGFVCLGQKTNYVAKIVKAFRRFRVLPEPELFADYQPLYAH